MNAALLRQSKEKCRDLIYVRVASKKGATIE